MAARYINVFSSVDRLSKLTLISALVSLILAIGVLSHFIYVKGRLAERPIEPVIVAVDDFGAIVFASTADRGRVDFDKLLQREVVNWIFACRSVSSDLTEFRKNVDLCASKLIPGSDAAEMVKSYYASINFKSFQKRYSRVLQLVSIVKITDAQFELEWIERDFTNDKKRATKQQVNMKGTVITSPIFLKDDERLLKNPLQLAIKSVFWVEKIKGG